jgi:hypothetical protein
MGEKLVAATDPVPTGRNNQEPGTEVPDKHNQRIESRKGRNNQEPGTEVPGRHNQRIESRKGRHRTTFVPIKLFLVRP